MTELKLIPGPSLISHQWVYDKTTEIGEWVDVDVTSRAHEFLFDDVDIGDGFTLADLFRLLEACPVLQQIMRRNFSDELMAEARKGVSQEFKAGYDPEGIEYLELYQLWHKNTAISEYQPTHRLNFHGVGYALREPVNQPDGFSHPVGYRIEWSVSCAPLRDLLLLPIKFKTKVIVCEDDLDAKKYAHMVEEVSVCSASLGQVLHGVMWELSFHGGPDGQAEVITDLKKSMAEIDNGTADLVSLDESDIFGDLDRPGIVAMFNSIGNHKISELTSELRALEDDEPVAAGLAKTTLSGVVVKPEYANLGARAFRKLFREAQRVES